MERMIQKVTPPARKKAPKLKRVAAYARVSSGREAPLHSLSAQISQYSGMIQKTPGWQYAGVYADEALTGTKDSRGEFQRLLADCRAGKIYLLTALNITFLFGTLIQTIRSDKPFGIGFTIVNMKIYPIINTIFSLGGVPQGIGNLKFAIGKMLNFS